VTDKTRLSDFTRANVNSGHVSIGQRADTGSGNHFGDSGSVRLDAEETERLRDLLVEEYGAEPHQVAEEALELVTEAREMLPDPDTDSAELRADHDALCEAAVELDRATEE